VQENPPVEFDLPETLNNNGNFALHSHGFPIRNETLGQSVDDNSSVNLVIVDQPVDRCRFRYKAEQGPHGALKGLATKGQKSAPKVKVSEFQI